jgi:hypothetical protein
MAQAQFVGPTPAEINDQSLARFMQGMAKLQEFKQFSMEQNRLQKIEDVKNKGGMLIKMAETLGDGDSMVGLKWMAQNQPGMFEDFMKTVGYDPASSQQIVYGLATSPNTLKQMDQMLRDMPIYFDTSGMGGSSEGSKSTQATSASESKTTEQKTVTPEGGGKGTEGELWNIALFDWARKNKDTLGLTGEFSVYDQMNQKYKVIAEKLGIKPEDQGGREVWFSPDITKQISDKVGNSGSGGFVRPVLGNLETERWERENPGVNASPNVNIDTDENFAQFVYQYSNDPENAQKMKDAGIKPVKTDPSSITNADAKKKIVGQIAAGNNRTGGVFGPAYQNWLSSQKGTVAVTGTTPAGAGEVPISRAELDSDTMRFASALNKIDAFRIAQAKQEQAEGAPHTQGLDETALRTAATHGNLRAAKPVRVITPVSTEAKVSTGGQAAGTTPPVSTGATGAAAPTGGVQSSATQESMDLFQGVKNQKDLRLAQQFASRLNNNIRYDTFLELAAKYPEEAKAYRLMADQSENRISSLAMMADPAGHTAWLKKQKDGTLDLERAQMKAQTDMMIDQGKIYAAQAANIPEENKIRNKQLEVALKEAEVALMNANNAPEEIAARGKLASLQLQQAQANLAASRLAAGAMVATELYKPVADGFDTVQNLYTQLGDLYNAIPKDKATGLPMADDTAIASVNAIIGQIQSMVRKINADGAVYIANIPKQEGQPALSWSPIEIPPLMSKQKILDGTVLWIFPKWKTVMAPGEATSLTKGGGAAPVTSKPTPENYQLPR